MAYQRKYGAHINTIKTSPAEGSKLIKLNGNVPWGLAKAAADSQPNSLLELSGHCVSAISEFDVGPDETNEPEDGRIQKFDVGCFQRSGGGSSELRRPSLGSFQPLF